MAALPAATSSIVMSGMTTRATVNLFVRHCHGKRRQFKAKTLRISANVAFANVRFGAPDGQQPDIAQCPKASKAAFRAGRREVAPLRRTRVNGFTSRLFKHG